MSVKNIIVSVLNIRVHSKHAPSEYKELWRMAFNLKKHGVYAKRALMIGEAMFSETDTNSFITGNFYRFTDINRDAPWFDINTKKKASDDDVNKIEIPPNLKPDLDFIYYVFDIKKHRLYFIAKEGNQTLPVSYLYRFLLTVFREDSIENRFGRVDVTVEMDREALNELHKWAVIKTLTFEIERPNGDEDEDEATFFENLSKKGARSEKREYKAINPSLGLNIMDGELGTLAKIASTNGRVQAKGKRLNGRNTSLDSKDHPRKVSLRIDNDKETTQDMVKQYIMSER